MSKVKSTKPKSEKPKAVTKVTTSYLSAGMLSPRDLREALKGKNATERNQLRRANALAVRNARKAKAVQA